MVTDTRIQVREDAVRGTDENVMAEYRQQLINDAAFQLWLAQEGVK